MKIRGTGADNTPVGELNLLNLKKNRAQAGQILMIPFPQAKALLGSKGTLLYLGPANDIWRPLLLTNLPTIVFADIKDGRQEVLQKLQREATCEDQLQIKTPWLRIKPGANEYKMVLRFRGEERTIIYAIGDATKKLPLSVARGYDVLLTSASHYVLFRNRSAFQTILGPLQANGFYLSSHLSTEGLAPRSFGLRPVFSINLYSAPDERIPIGVSDYYLIKRKPTGLTNLSEDLFTEWNLQHNLPRESDYALAPLIKQAGRVAEASPETYTEARQRFTFILSSLFIFVDYLNQFENPEKKRTYAANLGSVELCSNETENLVKQTIELINRDDPAKKAELLEKTTACFATLRSILN
ncbi:hypothetical protein COT42_04510 [Candidatus Saganbacteria bacterium CG08_land_8_20_14_0_20_45_16]|uniref:Uncharacterized protein n=1 Tax=Candidatus Saganbacteria bacterium CG08_land_8_20_14_0_20_45_16 TaxID=2014293 RepID=A0A2H0XZX7_UNCSA|nr:MAG: hypothetical protein COT42_04510 [Candidatus Saganbacteria bacterium CG08_land_8_20_14_0_20_45_16]